MPKKRIPSLNWLRVFAVAARTESFARAAEELNMSASAISQQVRALEGYLGKNLFLREAKRVRLTDSGRAFLPTVHQSLSSIETTAAAIFGSDEIEHITLQTDHLLAMGWLPKVVAEFEAAHPNCRVNVVTPQVWAQQTSDLPGWDPDLLVVFGSPSDFAQDAACLFGEEVSVVAREEVSRSVKSFADVASKPVYQIASHQVGWHQILEGQQEFSLDKLKIATVDSTPVALMMAAEGHGLALARSPASDGLLAALGLVVCENLPKVKGLQAYYLTHPPARSLSRGAAKLKLWLLSAKERA